MDWYDLLCAQGTLNSLLQHHSSKASILQRSVFVVQLLHPHMTTGKAAALTRWTIVSKVMFLLLFFFFCLFVSAFNMLSRFAIVFLPKSKHLLISWLQSPSAVILETKKIKSVTASTFSPSISHEVILAFFLMLSFKLNFYSTLSPSSKRSLVPLHFLPLKWYHLCIYISLT